MRVSERKSPEKFAKVLCRAPNPQMERFSEMFTLGGTAAGMDSGTYIRRLFERQNGHLGA